VVVLELLPAEVCIGEAGVSDINFRGPADNLAGYDLDFMRAVASHYFSSRCIATLPRLTIVSFGLPRTQRRLS
jgi:hypothetical protein